MVMRKQQPPPPPVLPLGSYELSETSDVTSSHQWSSCSSFTGSSGADQLYHYVGPHTDSGSFRHRHITADRIDIPNGVTLSWENMNCFAPEWKRGLLGRQVSTGLQKQLLHNVCGVAQPGQLIAIMGASGAGKTTLLNILTSRNLANLKATGCIKANGVEMGANIKRVSAYVQQLDVFKGCLTVEEYLWYNAVLRMGSAYSQEDKRKRVRQLLLEMGLLKVAHEPVQSNQGGRLSGSEKKLLSIACEIVVDPPLLFCDEPTTGLDSPMAENVVTLLQKMARNGKTILCTIHQPASHIFDKFDQVFLLAEGRLTFQGTQERALQFFSNVGFPCPQNYNPADHFIHTLAVRPGKEQECRAKVTYVARKFVDQPEYSSLQRRIQSINQMQSDPHFQEIMHLTQYSRPYKATWWSQLKVVTWKQTLDQVRNPKIIFTRTMQNIFLMLLMAVLYFRQEYNQKGVFNFKGLLFQIITQVTFISLIDLGNFCNELPIFYREHHNAMYRADVFFLAKNLAEIPIFLITIVTSVLSIYWSVNFYPSAQAFFTFTAVLCLLYQFSYAVNVLLIGVLCGRVDIALNVAPPFRIILMLFGGYMVNDVSYPAFIDWVKYLSWQRYTYELLSLNQWLPVTHIECEAGQVPESCYRNGEDVLRFLNFSINNEVFDYFMLGALMMVARALALLVLFIKAREKSVKKG